MESSTAFLQHHEISSRFVRQESRGHVCAQQQHMCGRAFLSYGHGFTSDSLRTHRYRCRYRSPHTTIIHNHAFTAFLKYVGLGALSKLSRPGKNLRPDVPDVPAFRSVPSLRVRW